MNKDTLMTEENPVLDHLTEFLRSAAQKMLQSAIEQEAQLLLERYREHYLPDGKRRLVKNGYCPERSIQTGIGSVAVKMPRLRDRQGSGEEAIRFYSSWIPKHMRRTASMDVLLPLLYLKGISTGDFQTALTPLLGEKARGLSPSVISALKAQWLTEYEAFTQQTMVSKSYSYWWVDGIYLSARMEEEKTCMLVIVGADHTGKKELVGLVDGFRESKESWLDLLRDLKRRGLRQGPKLAIGDGHLGFFSALNEVYPKTQAQRCWVHKTRNVLDKLPKTLHLQAKKDLKAIYDAVNLPKAEEAYQQFIESYGVKYPKALQCLSKDRLALFAFFDYPKAHWISIRTTNPIESTFATVRHRTIKSRGCFSRTTIVASVFKLIKEAEKRWKKLYGASHLALLASPCLNQHTTSDESEALLQEAARSTHSPHAA